MSVPPATRRTLVPLAVVTAAALLFTLLLLLMRLRWAPLESADHGAAAGLNSLVAGHPVVVSIVKAVTWLGSGGVLWALTRAGTRSVRSSATARCSFSPSNYPARPPASR